MRPNRAVMNHSKSVLKGMILASIGMACSYATAAPVVADASAQASSQQGELVSMKMRGNQAQQLRVHAPTAQSSFADIVGSNEPYKILLRNKVVVRIQGIKQLRSLIAALPESLGHVEIEGSLGDRIDAWELTTVDVRSAIAVAELLSADDAVRAAFVDSGRVADRQAIAEMYRDQMIERSKRPGAIAKRSARAPGIEPVNTGVDPAGTSDPDLASFWHMQNTLPIYLGRDNNITQDIYDVMGYTGAGVTVGIARPGNTEHLDFDHTDIDDNYSAALTMPVDTTLFPPDRVLTGIAGIVSAERDNGEGGHGVAPGATFATMSTGTDLLLANMLTYQKNNLDIKVIPSPGRNEFTTMGFASGYNNGAVSEFVGDFFNNSLKFGRDRKGSILVFSGGFSADFSGTAMPFYPDPYDGIGFDDLFTGNALEIIDPEEGGVYSSGPFYIRAQTYMYPFASDRRTFLINSVSEDGFADMNQAIGPAVFASVYTGTSNVATFFDNGAANPPRGIFSTVPGSVVEEAPDRTNNWTTNLDQFLDTTQVNGSSAAIAGGIIALMLEANPNLSVRDIQHIFFESIFESTRSASIRFPEFDPSLIYLTPTAIVGQAGVFSFWQINSGLYELPAGGVAAIRHSDQYGFGVIDAELAVSKAASWGGTPKLVLLDTGLVNEDSGVGDNEETRVPLEITDATFLEIDETSTFLIDGTSGVINQINICVRNNLIIESIVVELTVTGSAFNDIFLRLDSPWGTSSNLSYPTTRNALGTSFSETLNDDERDLVYEVGTLGTDQMSLIAHEFTTFKHWGELSGGTWRLNFYDFGPDAENAEGTPSEDGPPVVAAIPNVHDLGVFGLPGSEFREAKTVTGFRIKIYGYESGEAPFLGCDPLQTSCPGDLNGDGIINTADFNLFLSWYLSGDVRADMNNNGNIDFFDIGSYLAIFQPGFCTIGGGAPPNVGGRPSPNGGDPSDSNPPTRPI